MQTHPRSLGFPVVGLYAPTLCLAGLECCSHLGGGILIGQACEGLALNLKAFLHLSVSMSVCL